MVVTKAGASGIEVGVGMHGLRGQASAGSAMATIRVLAREMSAVQAAGIVKEDAESDFARCRRFEDVNAEDLVMLRRLHESSARRATLVKSSRAGRRGRLCLEMQVCREGGQSPVAQLPDDGA